MSYNPNQPPPPGGYPQQPPQGQPPYQPGSGGYPQQQPPPQGQPPYQPGGYPQQPPMGQPPYQQPGGYPQQQPPPPPGQQPPVQPQFNYQQAVSKITAPVATVDDADPFERVLSFIPYLWIIFFGFSSLFNFRVGSLEIAGRAFGTSSNTFSFDWDLRGLLGIVGPLAILMAVRKGNLVTFHARQALFLAIGFIVVRAMLQLLYLIPIDWWQNILVSGAIVPAVQLIFAFAAIFAGVRAFYNKELFTIPVIGGFLNRKSAAPPTGQPPAAYR